MASDILSIYRSSQVALIVSHYRFVTETASYYPFNLLNVKQTWGEWRGPRMSTCLSGGRNPHRPIGNSISIAAVRYILERWKSQVFFCLRGTACIARYNVSAANFFKQLVQMSSNWMKPRVSILSVSLIILDMIVRIQALCNQSCFYGQGEECSYKGRWPFKTVADVWCDVPGGKLSLWYRKCHAQKLFWNVLYSLSRWIVGPCFSVFLVSFMLNLFPKRIYVFVEADLKCKTIIINQRFQVALHVLD